MMIGPLRDPACDELLGLNACYILEMYILPAVLLGSGADADNGIYIYGASGNNIHSFNE
jgi:hypothetical protein